MILTLQKESAVPLVRPVTSKNERLESWLEELIECYKKMEDFRNEEPDEIFASLSAWTARASHMRSLINRSESKTNQAFRLKQIDPFISECDRQFKLWSRVFSVQTLDWNMNRNVT